MRIQFNNMHTQVANGTFNKQPATLNTSDLNYVERYHTDTHTDTHTYT